MSVEGIEGFEPRLNLEEIETFALEALEQIGKHHWDLSLFFCNNEIIRVLNKQYRNLDESTDVLSFVMGESEGERFLPGDIVISLERTQENAAEAHVSFDDELRRLLVHGMLHLAGMDHASNNAAEPMLVLQENMLKELREKTV
jgi:probable rRNA maturation factor